jgi:hypothetical protein
MSTTPLMNSLESVRRRVRWLAVLYGVGIVVSWAVGLLLGVVLLDYLLNLPPIPRIVLMIGALGALGYSIARWVARPISARLGLSDVAGKLEVAFPNFDDRLRSAVDFAMGDTPGSQAMKDRVAAQAERMAQQTDLSSAVQIRPVIHSLSGACAAILAVVLLGMTLGNDYVIPALTRLLTPFDGRAWPKRVEIGMVNRLPDRVSAGKQIDVRIRLIKGDRPSRQARVFYDYGDGRVEQEIMTRSADGVYAALLDARGEGNMKIWMAAGDDQTDPRTISILPRLEIKNVALVVTPPPYSAMPPNTVQLDAAPATVTYGSNLSLLVTFNKTLDPNHPIELIPAPATEGKLPLVNWEAPQGRTVSGSWSARDGSAFSIRAVDTDGFSNEDATEYQIIVRPDQPPSVQITKPAKNEECTPQAVIHLQAIAEDDFGISSLKLVAVKVADPPQPAESIDLIENGRIAGGANWTPMDSSGERRWQVDYAWDLSHLSSAGIKVGDVVEYHLEVTDNFSFEGQTHPAVSSAHYRITLMSQEQFTSLMGDLLQQVHEQVVEMRDAQRSLRDQTGDLRHETEKLKQFGNADRAAAESLVAAQATAASEARQAAQKLDDLASRMDENKSTAQDLRSIAGDVRDALNDIAEHPMKQAAAQIDDAKDLTATSPQDIAGRNAELDSAQANQQQAAEKLDQAASRIGETGGLTQAIQQLHDILDRQQQIGKKSDEIGLRNLGKTPDQLSDQDRKDQQENADQQNALAQKMQKAIDQLAAQGQKLAKSDPTSSQAMQQAAKSGQEQMVASQMQASADAQKQNQQSAAQQAQAQAEIGLQMMINQLEEAERRKLEELARQLADLQQQIQALVREQAALNYQNLALQGGNVLASADAKLVSHLLEDAQWTAGSTPPVSDLGTQERLQEQTERNTRSVAKAASPMPEGEAIASGLGRAADRMGRAITFLRDDSTADAQRLAGAYDPPQVEALAALEKVQEIVDEQVRKNQDALNQKKKDTIRAAYEKILAAQKVIDANTKQIDASPRDPSGQLGHRDSILLGQLPQQQGDLAERTKKMDRDLTALGGVVYVWANKDIVQVMQDVQGDLAKPETGAVTQAEQQRIEDQIQAMIDSLKVKPKISKFANPRSGGGGGSGGGGAPPPLPPEAELRLLKQLQQAINKATKTIAGQANPDAPKLTALGQRQGDIRNLLDQLLQKSSQGQVKLGPEPDAKTRLPEEATDESIDNQELEHSLLTGDGQPDSDQVKNSVDLVGQRMGRSHQRLADDHDPGNVTQEIQKRILKNLDDLIEMARAEQQEAQSGDSQSQQAGASDPDNSQQPNNTQGQPPKPVNNGTTPATVAVKGHDVDTSGTPTTDIAQTLKEWGALSPRRRAAVVEAASEKPIEKFKSFIDDYYRALGTRAGE